MDANTWGLIAVALLNAGTAFLAWKAKQQGASNGTAIAATEKKVDVLHETVNGRLSQLIAANAETATAQVAAARSEGMAEGRKTEEDRIK